MEKLRNEMEQNKDNKYIQVVGNFLLDYLRKHPAEVPAGKTIKGSLAEMSKEARKQGGNVGVLTDEEGFAVVLDYFGFKDKPEQKPLISGLSVTLDDLLES